MPDIAGNSLATATTLSLTTGVQSFPDLVTSTTSDYYRFSLLTASSLDVSLTNLDANADVNLLDSNGNLLTINGVPQQSVNSGNLAESINTTLNPGTYFIRVSAAASVAIANYTLNVTQGANEPESVILWRNPTADLTGIWQVDGASLISIDLFTANPGPGWLAEATGDFNKDGQLDVSWRNPNTGEVQLWLMNGVNAISAIPLSSAPPGWYMGGTGDFTGDGQTDLLWRNDAAGLVGIWALNGTQFVSAALLSETAPSDWRVAGVGDFNQDGKPDLVWQSTQAQAAGFWLMNGTSLSSIVLIPGRVPADWFITGTDDFNNDGFTDLLWRNYASTDNGVWLLNGVVFSSAYVLPSAPSDWISTAPYNIPGALIPIDIAGDTLATAFDLGTNVTGTGRYQNSISSVSTDFYKFTLGSTSQVNLALDGLTADLDLQLLDANGGIIQTVATPGLTPESINRTLNLGTYYIQIIPNNTSDRSPYSLGIAVNNLPQLTTNLPLTVNEQGTANLTSSQLRVTDSDNSDTQLIYTLGTLPTNGTLSVNGAVATPGITFTQADLDAGDRIQYIHNGSETTSDNFTFTVLDGSGGSIGTTTFNISVTPVNDPPVLTVPVSLTLDQNANSLVSGIQVVDPDAGTGALTVTLSVQNGTLTLGRTNNITGLQGNGTSTLTFSGQLDLINFVLGSLVYQSNTAYQGPDVLTIGVNDNGNTGIGGSLSDSKSTPLTISLVNQSPIITLPTSPSVSSDTDLSIPGVSIADPDAAGGTMAVTITALNGFVSLKTTAGLSFATPGNGSPNNRLTFSGPLFAINAALATLTYRSYPGFTNAFDRITISVNDNGNSGLGIPLADTETLLVNVGDAVNVVPTATNDSYGVAQNNTLSGNSVLGNDSDPDFTLPLTAQLGAGPTRAATFTLNSDGTFIYTPTTNFSGTDSFTYTASDALGAVSNVATVTITVTPVNQPPVATNDSYTTGSRGSLTIAAPGILTNDTDIDSSNLSAVLVSPTANGTLNLNPNGSFSYAPRAGFTGIDSFTYRANDGSLNSLNTATVNITVTLTPNAPPVANGDTFTTPTNSTLTVGSVLTNDTDPDNNTPLTASLLVGPANAATFTLNSNGTFTYVPQPNFSGNDTFTYVAQDSLGATSSPATATFSVTSVTPTNQPPVANGDTFTTPANSTLTVGSVLANDTDPDNNTPLTASLLVGPANAASFTLNPNGTFTYVPQPNFSGNDTFTYVAQDSLGATSSPATATFSVTSVTPTNRPPVANGDTFTTPTNSTLTVGSVLTNDTDPDNNTPLTASLLVGPANAASFTLNPNGTFTYVPQPNFSGNDTFTYVAQDSLGATSSPATATFSVTSVTPTNQPPVANGDAFTTPANSTLTVGSVLTNDTDPDNNTPLTASLLVGPANAASFTLNPNGTFTYVPQPNFSGNDTFTYVAQDSLGATSSPATATFSVTSITAPTANNDTLSVNAGSSLTIAAPGVLTNDTDPASRPLTASLVSTATNGTLSLDPTGAVVYTPNAGFSGNDLFTYVASDGTSTSNTATVSIRVNAIPVARNDSGYTAIVGTPLTVNASGGFGILGNDTDADNSTLTASVVSNPANGTLSLSPNGSFVYTPNAAFQGTDSFTYTASDGLATSNTAIVTISVRSISTPIANSDTYRAATNGTLTVNQINGVLINDVDANAPNSAWTATVVTGSTSGVTTLNPNGSFVYTPNPNFQGVDTFVYRFSDGLTVSNAATVTISVSPNTPPVANPDRYTVAVGSTLTVGSNQGILINDTDADGTTPTATLNTTTANGTLSLNANGTFTYTPNAGFSGLDSFTYQASDGIALSNPTTATITVAATPTAVSDTYSVAAGQTLTVGAPGGIPGLLANDIDPGGLSLSLIPSVPPNPTNGRLISYPNNGSFVYVPNPGFVGTDSFAYRATNGVLSSAPVTVTITVT